MTIKLALQNIADWIKEASMAAKGTVTVTLESGQLKNSLNELCQMGGVVGALFKLGSLAIPSPTAEQRIAAQLHRTFLTALDQEFKAHTHLISLDTWRRYKEVRMSEVAAQKLSGNFTWLSLFGSHGRIPSRSWPIVGELADVGRTWIVEMATWESGETIEGQQAADMIRGNLHKALTRTVDTLLAEPIVKQALEAAQPRSTRNALDFLAQELTTCTRYRLFDEIPQDALYISPTAKIGDYRDAANIDWTKIPSSKTGEERLFNAIRNGHPRLVIIKGDMGVGKSCLMRVLTARLAEQFRRDQRYAPVFVRWRDVFNKPDLMQAISDQLYGTYGLPLHDLQDHPDIVYLIDGFDEMRRHQEDVVMERFETLATLVQRRCTVVITMRSSIVTQALQRTWEKRRALVMCMQAFDQEDINAWTHKWREYTGVENVTGERLRTLAAPLRGTTAKTLENPLLLYMLAKYIDRAEREGGTLTSAEIFRIFVDETIEGKLRTSEGKLHTSAEDFPLSINPRIYRYLLQDMAYVASWPKHASTCPAHEVQAKMRARSPQLKFEDVRTAFVLHFFAPHNVEEDEFEFQPEAFRHYLLAEWCVRMQLQACADTNSQAIDELAQISLSIEERWFLNEIYEELGRLARCQPAILVDRLRTFDGTKRTPQEAVVLINKLYDDVRCQAERPPEHQWQVARSVGSPQGQERLIGLHTLRLLVNYWEQCLIATFGLYRGLGKDLSKESIFPDDRYALGRYFRARDAVRGPSPNSGLTLHSLGLQALDLRGASLARADLHGANLETTNLNMANLSEARLDNANLHQARLRGADLIDALLTGADLHGADLRGADLHRAHLTHANLCDADLSGTNMRGVDLNHADMRKAVLTRTDLSNPNRGWTRWAWIEPNMHQGPGWVEGWDLLDGAQLRQVDLREANLAEANLREVDLHEAKLEGATMNRTDLGRADLTDATGLTREQIKSAVTDAQTRLPNHLCFPEGSESPLGTSQNFTDALQGLGKEIWQDVDPLVYVDTERQDWETP